MSAGPLKFLSATLSGVRCCLALAHARFGLARFGLGSAWVICVVRQLTTAAGARLCAEDVWGCAPLVLSLRVFLLCVVGQQVTLNCAAKDGSPLVPGLRVFLLCVVITEHCIMLHEQPQCEGLFLLN